MLRRLTWRPIGYKNGPMKSTLVFVALLVLMAGCGSDDDSASAPATTTAPVTTSEATTPLTPGDVEEAFGAEVAGGGVVNLDDSPPKSIECEKGDGVQEWRCRISLSGGDSRVCVITVDPATRTVTQRTCGRIDN
jgi:hypothetical protein